MHGLLTRGWRGTGHFAVCILQFALLQGLACTQYVNLAPPADVRRAPEEAAGRLAGLRSFAFRLEYRTDVPFELGADLSGVWQAPGREQWEGTTYRGAEKSSVRLVADGERQYEMREGRWDRQPRGYETRVLEQFGDAFRGRVLTLADSGPVLGFDFTPLFPLLDPTRSKKLAGSLRIERRTGLPIQLAIEESSGVARWQMSFSRFNRAGRVLTPFVPETSFVLKPLGRASGAALGRMVAVLRARLDTLGWEYRLERESGRLVLALDRRLSREAAAVLLGKGEVSLHRAERTPVGDTGGMMVGDDAAYRVRLGQALGVNRQFGIENELEFIPEARLVFVAREPTRLDSGLVALVVDRKVASAARAEAGRVEFGDVGSKETGRVLAAVAKNEAMSVGFESLPR